MTPLPTMRPPTRSAQPEPCGDEGFTLVEVIVAVALFGLIAMAGLTLLDSELGVQARTNGRLERLGDMQRAMYVLSADLEQMSGEASVAGSTVAFRRFAADRPGGQVDVAYSLAGTDLLRTLAGRPQRLVSGVSAAQWSFYTDEAGWRRDWPQDNSLPRPSAAALDLTLVAAPNASAGTLRRVVSLPGRP